MWKLSRIIGEVQHSTLKQNPFGISGNIRYTFLIILFYNGGSPPLDNADG